MAAAEDHGPALVPSEIAEHAFTTSRRGYDTGEVRAFLATVADAYRALLARTVEAETGAATTIEAAEARAAELLREAQDEATRLLAGVADERQRGYDDGAAQAADVVAEAEEAGRRTIAEAAREAERLIAEAEGARRKVLRDLKRRRKTARAHLEQLQAARERLLGALSEVRAQIETTTSGLRDALPEAKAAADAAARRVAAEEDITVDQLEDELQAFRLAGLPLTAHADAPMPVGSPSADDSADDSADVDVDDEPAPVVAAVDEAAAAASTAPERRSAAVRIVRPMRPQDPITGLPEGELTPLEAPHPDEAVRLVTVEELAAEAEAVAPPPTEPVVAPIDPIIVVVDETGTPTPADQPPVSVDVADDDVVPADVVEPADDDVVEVVAERPAEPDGIDDAAVADDVAPVDVVEPVDDPVELVAERPAAPDRVDDAGLAADDVVPADVAAPADDGGARPAPEAVDAVFARLKAGRVARVAAAEAVLEPAGDDPTPAAADVEPAPPTQATVDASAPVVDEVVVHRGGGADRDALLARRDAAIGPMVSSLARRLKRLLADEQNELLTDLRHRGTAGALLPAGEHGARWAAEASVDLAVAATAGMAFLTPGEATDLDLTPGDLVEVAEAFAVQFAAPLHHRLQQTLDGEDDPEIAADRVRSIYRTWRSERLGAAVEHAVLDAFAAGMAGRCPAGTPVCWVVDDGGTPCPDGEDNALAGVVASGEPFPTGHLRPPVHPGCRCLVVPADAAGAAAGDTGVVLTAAAARAAG